MSYQEAKLILPKRNAAGDSCAAIHDELTRTMMDSYLTVIKAPIEMVAIDVHGRMVYEAGILYTIYGTGRADDKQLFVEIAKTYAQRFKIPFVLAANFGSRLEMMAQADHEHR